MTIGSRRPACRSGGRGRRDRLPGVAWAGGRTGIRRGPWTCTPRPATRPPASPGCACTGGTGHDDWDPTPFHKGVGSQSSCPVPPVQAHPGDAGGRVAGRGVQVVDLLPLLGSTALAESPSDRLPKQPLVVDPVAHGRQMSRAFETRVTRSPPGLPIWRPWATGSTTRGCLGRSASRAATSSPWSRRPGTSATSRPTATPASSATTRRQAVGRGFGEGRATEQGQQNGQNGSACERASDPNRHVPSLPCRRTQVMRVGE
jgi:hypothetical protein